MENPFEIIRSPWVDKFKSLLIETKKEFVFTSPYIKTPAVKMIMGLRNNDFSIKGITSFRLRNFERGASDLDALNLLISNNAALKNIPNLHSKIYIFDSTAAIITSANFTPSGMAGNIETGIVIREGSIISDLKKGFAELFYDKGISFDISDEVIETSKKIIESIPEKYKPAEGAINYKEIEKHLFIEEEKGEDKMFHGGAGLILKGLTGWKHDVFQCLDLLKDNEFRLEDIYKYEDILSVKHPENKNIQAKIRQQMQIFRDMGLIEFSTYHGNYKKLW